MEKEPLWSEVEEKYHVETATIRTYWKKA